MDNKLLDELLEQLEEARPRFGLIRGALRVYKVQDLRGERWHSYSDRELTFALRLLEQDRLIEKLQKPAKKTAKKKAE